MDGVRIVAGVSTSKEAASACLEEAKNLRNFCTHALTRDGLDACVAKAQAVAV